MLALAEQVEAAIVDARSGRGSPELIGRRVGRAIERVLESDEARAARRQRRPERSRADLDELRRRAITAEPIVSARGG